MSLQNLSDQELEIKFFSLVQKEREVLHLILAHVAEVDRRKMYLQRGHSSLFAYLVKDCHYSESAAMRRIEAARLFTSVPSLPEKIKSGEVNLTQIGELSRALKQSGVQASAQKKIELVEKISGLSTPQTQGVLSKALDIALRPAEKQQVQKDESVHVQITFTKEQYEKLLRCKDSLAESSMNEMIMCLAEKYLKTTTITSAAVVKKAAALKSVTPKKRREILLRDQCCQYKDKLTGRKCGSTFDLQVDHIHPQWDRGGHESENLQVLCAAHNRHRYREQVGLR